MKLRTLWRPSTEDFLNSLDLNNSERIRPAYVAEAVGAAGLIGPTGPDWKRWLCHFLAVSLGLTGSESVGGCGYAATVLVSKRRVFGMKRSFDAIKAGGIAAK